jgi:hypothetical protein
MITIFACPKPFHGHINVIQRNAIKSWFLLRPKPEILLLGDDEGVAEICNEFNLIHISDIEKNEYGTPFISSIFQISQEKASYPTLCYINSDIILMSDFMRAVETVTAKMPIFLIIGQRYDLTIREMWDFDNILWEAQLKSLLAKDGSLHAPTGIDFFMFTKGMYSSIPPFAIGRPGWDNWLVWQTRMSNIPIIDATKSVVIAHQNHEYPGILKKFSDIEINSCFRGKNSKKPKIYDRDSYNLGPEALQNFALVSDEQNLNIRAATWMIDSQGGLKRRRFELKFSYVYYHLLFILPLYWPAFGRFIHWLDTASKTALRSLNRKNKILNK